MEPKTNNTASTSRLRQLVQLILLLFITHTGSAQVTVINTESLATSGYNSATSTGTGGTRFITFAIYNNTGSSIKLTTLGRYVTTSHNGTTSTIYYSSTSLSGTVGTLPTTGWTQIDHDTISGVTASAIDTVNTNINFVIPNGATYRFACLTSGTNSYSSSGTPNNFTVNNISLYAGNYQISSANVGYAASITPRYFRGFVVFEPSCPVNITTQPKDSTICAGGNANFNIVATGTTAYQWQVSTNGGSTWSNIANTGVYSGATTNSLALTAPGTSMNDYRYRCIATNTANSCSQTSNAGRLTVNQPPAILTTTPGAGCTGTPVQVSATASGGATVQWYNQASGGTLLGTGNTLNIASAPASNTTYYAYPNITNTTCTATVRTGVQVIVNGPPAVTANPADSTICANGDARFVIAATGASTYQWEVSTDGGGTWNNVNNSSVYSGATGSALNITGGTTSMDGYKYRCKASCTSTATSNPSTLTVNAPPSVTNHPSNVTICSGGNTSFSCAATGAGPLSYQWEISTDGGSNWSNVINGGIYSNATTSTLDITGATVAANDYRFRCAVSGICAPGTTSNPAILTVNSLPAVTGSPTSEADCPGSNISFTCTATGTSVSYQWQEFTTVWNNLSNGGSYSGVTTNTLTISNITTTLNGRVYRCIIGGACSPADTTDTATITVYPNPNITGSSNSPVCEEDNLQLNSTSTTSGVSYSWTGPNSFSSTLQNPAIASPVVAHTGNFVVTATVTATGCTAQATVPVVVKLKPATPTLTSNSAVCTGYDIELTANSTTGSTYSWTGPQNFSSPLQNPKRLNANNPMEGYYTAVATINGCPSEPDSIYVDIVPSPFIGAFPSPGNKICVGETISFFGVSSNTGTDPMYQWMKNNIPIPGADSLKYVSSGLVTGDVIKLRMTPGNDVSCNDDIFSVDIPIIVQPYLAPAVYIIMDPPSNIWPGLLVTFTATGTDAGSKPQYQWKLNGQDIQGATDKTWATTSLANNDIVTCDIVSDYDCPQPVTASSNAITVPVQVSVSSINGIEDIALYPNPNKGSFTIKGKVNSARATVEIINAVGQTVYSKEITTTNGKLYEEINAGNVPDGIYLLRVNADEQQNNLRFRIIN